MSLNQLTTLSRAKAWLSVSSSSEDALLSRLISEVSRFILSYLERPTLFQYIFSDWHDGLGQESQTLRHWPVRSVALVQADGVTIPPAVNGHSSGFFLEEWDGLPPGRPQSVHLRGYHFPRGPFNVNILYTAGYGIADEAHSVPEDAPYTLTVDAPHGHFAIDQGVRYAGGLSLVNTAGAPAAGQYSVTDGVYTFNASDAEENVLISYSYIPADVEHACLELVGERYRYRGRIGETSKSLGGAETASFSQKDMPEFIRLLLQPYKRAILV